MTNYFENEFKPDISPKPDTSNHGRFNKEQRNALDGMHCIILTLDGRTIAELRSAGWPIFSHDSMQDSVKPMRGEIAFLPTLILPHSNNKTCIQQLNMVTQLDEAIQKKASGIAVMAAKPVDYAAATFQYFKDTQKWLFGRRNKNVFTRARNRFNGRLDIIAGNYNAMDGFCIEAFGLDDARGDVYIAPLLFPKSSVSAGNANYYISSK